MAATPAELPALLTKGKQIMDPSSSASESSWWGGISEYASNNHVRKEMV